MKSEVEHYENRCGGKGTMHIERLLQKRGNGKRREDVCEGDD